MTHLSIAYWCVLIAALLPFVCAYLAKSRGFGKAVASGGYDNHEPRAWLARQTGWQARANAAQAAADVNPRRVSWLFFMGEASGSRPVARLATGDCSRIGNIPGGFSLAVSSR